MSNTSPPPAKWTSTAQAWKDLPDGKGFVPSKLRNADAKEAWCSALERGHYAQGKNKLRREDTFCCLGVACDVSATGTWDDGSYGGSSGSDDSSLPLSVVAWLGAEREDPQVRWHGKKVWLSTLNDSTSLDFVEIAAIIREQL